MLINFLYSTFPIEEIQLQQLVTFSDNLRIGYHHLSHQNEPIERKKNLSLIFSVLTLKSEIMSDMDWYYSERILVHYANLCSTSNGPIISVLGRQ